jgi:hypothetical protein
MDDGVSETESVEKAEMEEMMTVIVTTADRYVRADGATGALAIMLYLPIL